VLDSLDNLMVINWVGFGISKDLYRLPCSVPANNDRTVRWQIMTTDSPLEDWHFLIGQWKGRSTDQFGETGELESIIKLTLELGRRAIMGIYETKQNDKIINQEISVLFFDVLNKVFRRKSFFSYGFVTNEVSYEHSSTALRFDITFEPLPTQFKGTRWCSFITKVSPTQILEGLEQAKKGEDFKLYGEVQLEKVS